MLGAFINIYQSWNVRNHSFNQFNGFSDRELRDLGVERDYWGRTIRRYR